MTKIKARTTDSTFNAGRLASQDLEKHGYVSIVFFVSTLKIGIEIAGICTEKTYFFNPLNDKQKRLNTEFLLNYVNKCENSDQLKKQLNIN